MSGNTPVERTTYCSNQIKIFAFAVISVTLIGGIMTRCKDCAPGVIAAVLLGLMTLVSSVVYYLFCMNKSETA